MIKQGKVAQKKQQQMNEMVAGIVDLLLFMTCVTCGSTKKEKQRSLK